jgi:raffinose/stachyose/melibiose transport system substrate-binding protein
MLVKSIYIVGFVMLAVLTACSSEFRDMDPKKVAKPKIALELLSNKPDTNETMEKIITKFRESNPGIEIEQNAPPNMLKVLSMRFSTGNTPALFTVYPSAPSMRQPVKDGYIEDLTGDPILKHILPAFVEFSQTNGKNYAIPYALEGYGVIYNVDLFRSLNLDIPQTYAELIRIAEQLKAAGRTPFVFADKDYTYVRRVSTVLLGLDNPDIIPFFEEVIAGKKHFGESVELNRLAQKTLELRTYGQKDLLGTSIENAVRDFASGKAAMYFTGMWDINPIKKANPDINADMFPFPAVKAEDTKVAMQVGTAIGIPKDLKDAGEAKKFLEFFATTEIAQLYSDETQNISVIKGVQHKAKENKRLAEYALRGKLFRAADSPWTPSMQDDFGKVMQELIAGSSHDSFERKMDEIFYNK